MRILLVDNTPRLGGSVCSAAETVCGVASPDFQFGLFASRPDLFTPYVGDRMAEFPVSWDGFRNVFDPALGWNAGPPILGTTLALRRFARRLVPEFERTLASFRPDLVHVNNLNIQNGPLIAAARRANLPTIVHARMIRAFGWRALRAAGAATRIICVSQAVRQTLLDHHPFPAESLIVFPDSVPVASFDTISREEARRALDWPADAALVVLLGRVEKWKGHHVAIAAWPRVKRDHPHARLMVVGDGDAGYLAQCRAQAESLGVAEDILFVGHRDDVPVVLAASDIVLHTSCYSRPEQGTVEAFGRVVIEGMAARRAVIATNAGGPAELIDEGVTGRLVVPGDPERLAVALTEALADPDWRARVADAGRAKAEREFDNAPVAARMRDVYRQVLAAK